MCIFHRDFDYLNPFLESRKTPHTYIFLGPKEALFFAVHTTLFLVAVRLVRDGCVLYAPFYLQSVEKGEGKSKVKTS